LIDSEFYKSAEQVERWQVRGEHITKAQLLWYAVLSSSDADETNN